MSELPRGTVSLLFTDIANGSTSFLQLNGDNIRDTASANVAYFDRPRHNREIDRIGRLSGDDRRLAWAERDHEMMRDDPPWAPTVNYARRDLVSESFGCFVYNPVYGVDIAAACKK